MAIQRTPSQFRGYERQALLTISTVVSLVLTFFAQSSAYAMNSPKKPKSCPGAIRTVGEPLEAEANYLFPVATNIAAEKKVLRQMRDNLPGLYERLQEDAAKQMAAGKDDFSYPIMNSVLERIRIDLEIRKTRKFGAKYTAELESVRASAKRVLDAQTPYKATVNFIFKEYLPLIDKIFGERHPDLMKNEYHRGHAEHLLEQFLKHKPGQPPEMLLYFSFESVDAEYFLDARTGPMFLVGLYTAGLDDDLEHVPFADGFKMKPSEFSWHDMGHIDFMWLIHDKAYLNATSKPLLRVMKEWEATRLRYKEFLSEYRDDKLLRHAMVLLLVELIHERGFQYSFSVLKKELETRKWVDILIRKLGNGYYKVFPQIYTDCFSRLEEARDLLLAFTRKGKTEAQAKWFEAIQADRVPSRFIYNAPLRYGSGPARDIRIIGARPQDFRVTLTNRETGSNDETDIIHLLLPQVDPAKSHPLSEDAIHKIKQLVGYIQRGEVLPGLNKKVAAVVVTGDKKIQVEFVGDKTVMNLTDVTLPAQAQPFEIDNLRFFEITQILGSEERKVPLAYTVEKPAVIMEGVATLVKNPVTGETRLLLRNHRTGQFIGNYNLADMRIDALNLVESEH